jgi:hypothetical protein
VSNLTLVMDKAICPSCSKETYVFFKGRECMDNFLCECGFYPFNESKNKESEKELNGESEDCPIHQRVGDTTVDEGNEG